MTRVAASILSFYYKAKNIKVDSIVMMKKISKELASRSNKYDILHLDIMDGKFVANVSFKPSDIKLLKYDKKREIHLMTVDYNK